MHPGVGQEVPQDQDQSLTGTRSGEYQANGASRHPLARDDRYVLISCRCGAWSDYVTRPAPSEKVYCPSCPA